MGLNIKHSKYKNTGLIFEFLLRQITVDVLNDKAKSFSLNLIKSCFNEHTELGKELNLYNILIKEKLSSDKKADFLISEVLKQREGLNNSKLKREKYNLIKSIRENIDVNQFFSSKVPEYKTYASIYKLFEYNTKLSPEEKTESYFNILENITTKKKGINLSETINKKLPQDSDLRILTYKTLLEKFNKKYSGLNGNQRKLLKAYINNVSNTNYLKEYIETKIPYLKKELKKHIPDVKDKVVKIKLKEAVASINKFCKVGKNSVVKDSVVVQLMRYYELLKELKNARK